MDFLPTNQFRVKIGRLAGLEYFAQRVQMPDASIGTAEQATPFKQIKRPADKIDYGQLVVTFKVSEDLTNYFAIHDWMHALARGEDFVEYAQLERGDEGIVSDLTVVLSDSKGNPAASVTFRDVFPVTLGSVQLDATATDVIHATVDVVFEHNGFSVTRPG